MKSEHPGYPNSPVVCVQRQGFLSNQDFYLDEIKEVKLDRASNEIAKFLTDGVILSDQSIARMPRPFDDMNASFPLQITTKNGDDFTVARREMKYQNIVTWRACNENKVNRNRFTWPIKILSVNLVGSRQWFSISVMQIIGLQPVSVEELASLRSEQKSDFDRLKAASASPLEWSKFELRYAENDLAGLIYLARMELSRAVDAENAPFIAEKQRKNKLEYEARQTRIATFRQSVKIGTETNCGPVVEIKGQLLKVYHPIPSFGNEHWLRLEQILLPSMECNFFNGIYSPPRE